jgi:hypothetical protein
MEIEVKKIIFFDPFHGKVYYLKKDKRTNKLWLRIWLEIKIKLTSYLKV